MATGDISRNAFDPNKHYSGVRMQQGRVITDDDWNANERIEDEDHRRARVDIIGPAGTPDDGFRIDNPTIDTNNNIDFDILAGSFYLGGLRLEMEKMAEVETFLTQKDRLQQPDNLPKGPTTGTVERFDLVYLEAWQQPVSAVEDKELFEVALGGPDTSTRMRTMRRVRVKTNIGEDNCEAAWESLKNTWINDNKGTLNQHNERVPDVKLKVGFSGDGSRKDLCKPDVHGGYLGAENQAIRVQLVDETHFTWGFDNASPLYRVQVASDGVTVSMLTEPKDQAHWPLVGQAVEILPRSAVLPNGEKIAEIQGQLFKVATSYNPDDSTLTLDAPLDTNFVKEWEEDANGVVSVVIPDYLFMRVWNRGPDRSSNAKIPINPAPVTLEHTGIEVTITGNDCVAGDYWIIAARPETPNQVVPWELEQGKPPNGIRRFYAPLAIIRWGYEDQKIVGEVIRDCRKTFKPLTAQTDHESCCAVTVGAGGDFNKIQEAVAYLSGGEGGRICILPGEYDEKVSIRDAENIAITGCGEDTRIFSGNPEPVIYVKNSQNIRIESLSISAHDNEIGILLEGNPPGGLSEAYYTTEGTTLLREITLSDLHITAATCSAVQAQGCHFLTIRGCRIQMKNIQGTSPGIFVVGDDVLIRDNVIKVEPGETNAGNETPKVLARGGLQVGGTSDRVRIINNLIQGGKGSGITLGSIKILDQQNNIFREYFQWFTRYLDICMPGSTFIPHTEEDEEGEKKKTSVGALSEIHIEGNRIFDMGLNGIGAAGFFSLVETDEFITVERLTILNNEIRRCLQSPLEIPAEMINSMGYGGISLADVEYLVIQGNIIEDNGPDHLEPICGIFILHGEGVDISNNRILNNGAKTDEPSKGAKPGPRGGINILYTVAPTLPLTILDIELPRQDGVPAARIHDNIVTTPLGRALSIIALGPVSVVGNQFTSKGVVLRYIPSLIAATVGIVNLGVSNELYGQLFLFSTLSQRNPETFGSRYNAYYTTDDAVFFPQEGLDDLAVGKYLANGNVLFSNNQCVLDLLEIEIGFSVSSILIFSLDDIGFHNNQCDCSMFIDFILSQAILLGFSLRVSDNRFKEGFFNALFSAITMGLLNRTALNQATHCIWANGLFGGATPNTVLVNSLFGKESYCFKFKNLFGNWSK